MAIPKSDFPKDEKLTDSPHRLAERETQIRAQFERLQELERQLQNKEAALLDKEQQLRDHEKSMKEKEKAKKQILLRLSPSLWEELAIWAEDDFRSINSQIEYLLSACVRERKKVK